MVLLLRFDLILLRVLCGGLGGLGVTRAAFVCDGEVDMIFDRIQYTEDARNR